METERKTEIVYCNVCKHKPVVTDPDHPYGFGINGPEIQVNGPCFEYSYEDQTCPFLCDDQYYNRMPADDMYCGLGEEK